eukprot:COSAG06_NODE_54830_length_292_cov_1.347150_2_plen_21_part_01
MLLLLLLRVRVRVLWRTVLRR